MSADGDTVRKFIVSGRGVRSEPLAALARLEAAAGNDPDYSPAFQDEYQRLWHEAAKQRDALAEALRRIQASAWDATGACNEAALAALAEAGLE